MSWGVGQFLLGGAVGATIGGVMIKTHSMAHTSMLYHMRAVTSGSKTFQEYDHKGSIMAALVDARAWNRLVLDVHGKVLEFWPK
mmetsp:Transcript_4331/g.6908  ORF Transcript_4331/g.6908 Transcript_4331/m.6908 type:complete len:84 (+) Transcript_4331:93-344(+)|eukprot:CAMPEP_0115061076 /NCGR_PEP_ID=MMETSP0227-20121206/7807_1 /TAXON_ID=89957 /ORGANISM="Polarella glacialis, Strain CCMP 1383" /LENGTH=83 /DNA_ID=CAMNT_0002446339 /DNA_START=35 /DNA_END=286 /DNA_ORIENTATION=-